MLVETKIAEIEQLAEDQSVTLFNINVHIKGETFETEWRVKKRFSDFVDFHQKYSKQPLYTEDVCSNGVHELPSLPPKSLDPQKKSLQKKQVLFERYLESLCLPQSPSFFSPLFAQFLQTSNVSGKELELLEVVEDDVKNYFKIINNKQVKANGFLEKEGGRIKTIKKRFFILFGFDLYYFKNDITAWPTQTQFISTWEIPDLCGVISVRNRIATATLTQEEKKSKPKHTFKIFTPYRTYYIHPIAETGDEAELLQYKDYWVKALKQVSKESTFLENIEDVPKLQGYLTKQGNKIKTWKRRFVKLNPQNGLLYYFKTNQEAKPSGFIHMPGSHVRLLKSKESQEEVEKNHVIRIESNNRIWYLFAETSEHIDLWYVPLLKASMLFNGKTIRVSDTHELTKAMDTAVDEDRILLAPGNYLLQLKCNKVIRFEAEKKEKPPVLLRTKDDTSTAPLILQTSRCCFYHYIHMEVESKDDSNQMEELAALEVNKGCAFLLHCSIKNKRGSGIKVNSKGTLLCSNTRIHHCQYCGIQLTSDSNAIIENCTIECNKSEGIFAMGSLADLKIRNCKIIQNCFNGVASSIGGELHIQNSDISNNEYDGICINNDPTVLSIFDNQINSNKGYGIYGGCGVGEHYLIVDNEMKNNTKGVQDAADIVSDAKDLYQAIRLKEDEEAKQKVEPSDVIQIYG